MELGASTFHWEDCSHFACVSVLHEFTYARHCPSENVSAPQIHRFYGHFLLEAPLLLAALAMRVGLRPPWCRKPNVTDLFLVCGVPRNDIV